MKIKVKQIYVTFLFVFPILSFQLYNIVYIDKQIAKLLYFIFVTIAIIYTAPRFLKYKINSRYENLIKILFILIWVSMFNALFFWGQDLILSYRATAPYLALVYFLVLMSIKPDIQTMEKIIWFYCALFIILWCYGMLKAPQIIYAFDADTTMDDSRGIFRLALPGRGFLVLGFFLAVSKYVQLKQNKWLVLLAFLFVIIVFQVTRQIIAISFLVSVVYILRNNKVALIATIILMIFLMMGGNAIDFQKNSTIGNMVNLTLDQLTSQKSGDDNVRLLEYNYFLTNYSKNMITDIFGNGIPHFQSSFGLKEISIREQFSYFMSDVGYAAIFVRFGVIGLVLYLFVFVKAAFQKVDKQYIYAKLFIIYLAIANVTAAWVFEDVISLCICLYILEQYNIYIKEKTLISANGERNN